MDLTAAIDRLFESKKRALLAAQSAKPATQEPSPLSAKDELTFSERRLLAGFIPTKRLK